VWKHAGAPRRFVTGRNLFEAAAFALPVVTAAAWTKYTDLAKSESAIGRRLVSSELVG